MATSSCLFLPLLLTDSVFLSIPWFRNFTFYLHVICSVTYTGCSGSIEARRSFSYSRSRSCKTCRSIEKRKKNEREVREIFGHCTDRLMAWQSYSEHLYSDKARRFIQIRTSKKKIWQKVVRWCAKRLCVVYWTKQFARFLKFSKSWVKICTSHFLRRNPYLCEKLFVISPQRSLRVQRMADVVQNLFPLLCLTFTRLSEL